jgi:hypothetical protein
VCVCVCVFTVWLFAVLSEDGRLLRNFRRQLLFLSSGSGSRNVHLAIVEAVSKG